MSKCYIGLDPGSKGCAVIMNGAEIKRYSFIDFSMTDICQLLKDQKSKSECYALLEDVHAVFGSSAKATFEFGFNKGMLSGILIALQIPFSMIPPKKWQTGVWERCDKVMDGKKIKTKETSFNCAKRIFPHVNLCRTSRCTKPDDGICDALLMAEYARRNNF